MRRTRSFGASGALATLIVAILCGAVRAQYTPTATGRTIQMSDPGWKLFIPDKYKQRGSLADVIVHFHGDPTIYQSNVVNANLDAIIVTVNYNGLSSVYQTPFQNNTSLFSTIINEAQTDVRALPDFPDNLVWDKVGVSSFSAGWAAVREILKQKVNYDRISNYAATDSIYASYTSSTDHTPLDSQMADFRKFAADAVAGKKTFILSQSQIATPGYCDTPTCANDLMAWVGGTAVPYTAVGPGSMQFYRYMDKGNFTVYGATGADAAAHTKHLQYGGQFLDELSLATLVPEPGSAGLVAIGSFVLLRRRRRIFRALSC